MKLTTEQIKQLTVGALWSQEKEDGLHFYRRIIADASKYLNEDGKLLFEIGHDQGEAVSELMKEAGFQDVRVVKDLAGNDRVVIGGL